MKWTRHPSMMPCSAYRLRFHLTEKWALAPRPLPHMGRFNPRRVSSSLATRLSKWGELKAGPRVCARERAGQCVSVWAQAAAPPRLTGSSLFTCSSLHLGLRQSLCVVHQRSLHPWSIRTHSCLFAVLATELRTSEKALNEREREREECIGKIENCIRNRE
jgi:hypothetical protein